MTFIASSQAFGDLVRPLVPGRKPLRASGRLRLGEEDGARKALGTDGHGPAGVRAGSSLEDLARIALG